MITEIEVVRNKIAFEGLGSCGCGNEGMHAAAARAAWENEVERFVPTRTGKDEVLGETVGETLICSRLKYDSDPGKRDIYITTETPIKSDDEGDENLELLWLVPSDPDKTHCVTEGHYADVPTADVLAAAKATIDADDAAMDAARKAYEADCDQIGSEA